MQFTDAASTIAVDAATPFFDVEGWARATAPAGCWFDEAAAAKACDFFPRYLRFTEGEWAGRPFVPSDWERAVLRATFGWKNADGTRRFRVVFIEVGRKNGKTEFAAGLALLIELADGEYGGQVYSAAVNQDQARVVFNKASVMVQFSPALTRDLEVFKTSIFCAKLHARFSPLSSTPGSKHGFNPSGAVYDEVHEWPSGELAQVVHEGMSARRQPLEIYTTTAGEKDRGYGWEMHEKAIRVRDGEIVDPAFLPVIYAASEADDWKDEATWRKANPNLGVSPKIEFLRGLCEDAKRAPRLENRFRRYYLNQWTEQVTRWLPMDDWHACAGAVRWPELPAAMKGETCYLGLDLAQARDLSAAVKVFPPAPAKGRLHWTIVPRFWLPAQTVERKIDNVKRRDDYRRWAAASALVLTPGDAVDYATIKAAIVEDCENYDVRRIPFDKFTCAQLGQELYNELGLPAVKFEQTVENFNEPSKAFEEAVTSRNIAHGGHPVLAWMAGNVAVYERPQDGAIKPDKFAGGAKIDGIVAAIMAWGEAIIRPAGNGVAIAADYSMVA